MIAVRRTLLAIALVVVTLVSGRAQAGDRLEAARYFDQLGVRAYAEGRYAEARLYFHQAYENGGPPSELWNIAKCELQLGDARSAVNILDGYLSRDDLPPEDRREAEKLLADIKRRPSQLSIASAPGRASVKIDDQLVGTTPLTTTVAPGAHSIHLEEPGGGTFDRTITAEYGLPMALGAELGTATDTTPPPPPPKGPVKRFAIEVMPVGISAGIRGDAPASVFVTPVVGFTFTLVAGRRALLGAGVRLAFAVDRWSVSPGVSNTAAGCNLPTDYSAVELFAHPFLFGAVRVGKSVDLGARAGFGLAGYASPAALGGDYFVPDCNTSTGLRGDFFAALDASFQVGSFRILVEPLTLNLHSGYGGAVATGLWARVGASIGMAIDF